MFAQIDKIITAIDNAVWGLPLICLIMATGIFLTARLGLVQIRHLGKAFKFMFIYSILYNPCIFKAYRLLNVQT